MKGFLLVLVLMLAFCLVDSAYADNVNLEVIQKFNYKAGLKNQVKFADVNGDGHEDLLASYSDKEQDKNVVGIWYYNPSEEKFSDSVDVRINLNFAANGVWFNVGDVNSDGKADIIMMSSYSLYHAPKIVWGSDNLPELITVSDVNCTYPADSDYTQTAQYTSVTIGDFNGDGIDDFIVPDQGTKISTGNYGGRALVYFGDVGFNGTPDMVLTYEGTDQGIIIDDSDSTEINLRWFGPFMDVGDFNGDGYTDLFAGAFYSTTTITLVSAVTGQEQEIWNSGAGVVFLGGPDFDDVPDAVLLPPDEFLQFTTATDFMYCGYWAFNAGDINGNGADDFSLPSWYWAVNFVYSGNRSLMQAPTLYQTRVIREPAFYFTKDRYNNLGYSDQNGATLVPVGDIDGDGIPDLANSKNYYGSGPLDHGIRLFFGKRENAGEITFDYESSDYKQVQSSNKDFDGDGVADLVIHDLDGYLTLAKIVKVTGIAEDQKVIPCDFELKQNFPNPFNPFTNISYKIPFSDLVMINVYDVSGNLIKTLVNEIVDAGNHTVHFDASELPSGVYFYKIHTSNFVEAKKMVFLK